MTYLRWPVLCTPLRGRRSGKHPAIIRLQHSTRNFTMSPHATPTPGSLLLTPQDHALIMIDFQSQMLFAQHSIDATVLRTNAALVAHAAAGFGVPSILTTVAEKSFSGPMFDEILKAFP